MRGCEMVLERVPIVINLVKEDRLGLAFRFENIEPVAAFLLLDRGAGIGVDKGSKGVALPVVQAKVHQNSEAAHADDLASQG